jgi:hypothetical protein
VMSLSFDCEGSCTQKTAKTLKYITWIIY